ncbi:TonB-dependent receptor [Tsuneonella sp. HG249]
MSRSRLNAVWRATPVIAPMLVAAAGLGAYSPAYAQEAPTDAAREALLPGEIVVTAQRREESLSDVPISIVAIGNEELTNRNVTDASRLEQVAPGLQLGRSGTDVRPAIRGTYTEQIQGNSDPRVGFYIDEIYQSRTSQLSVPFVDLARVEVQKGPQGTLYGRNSFGGNIALITNVPDDDRVEGGVDLLYGDYDRLLASAFVNLPIADGLAARFAGAIERRDPYIISVTNPAASYDDLNQQYIRGALRWAPPGMDNGLEIILRGSYWHQDDAGANTFNSKAIGVLVDPSLITQPGGTLNIGGGTFTLPQGFNGRSFATGQFFPYNAFRDGIPDINGADIGIMIPGPYLALNDEPNFNRVNSKQFSATVNVDLSDWLAFRSITGYVDFKAVRGGDNDGTPAPFGVAYFITENKAFSQELQLLSNDKASPLQYTFGAYYLHDRVPDGFLSARPNRQYGTAFALANGLTPLYFGSNFTLLPSTAPFSNAFFGPGSDAWNPLSYLDTKSYAGYGQVSYTFAEKLTVTGGLRYTVDDKNFYSALGNAGAPAGSFLAYEPDLSFNRECNGFTPANTTTGGVVSNALVTRCGQKTFKFFTYRAAVDYKPNDDMLLYASYSTGRRSGGFSYSVIPGTADNSLPFVDTEGVEAWEAGLKASLFDRRVQVNLAAFYNKYSNLQVQRSFPNPAQANSVITVGGNGGTGDAPGIDLELTAQPFERLRLNVAANYLRARVDPFPAPTFSNGICDIVAPGGTCTTRPEVRYGFGGGITPNPVSNPELFVPVLGANGQQLFVNGIPQFETLGTGKRDRVQNQSDFTLRAGIAYDIDLGGMGTLTPEVQTYYNDGYLLSPLLVNFEQESYTKTDLYLTWRSEEEDLSLQAFVQNLENEAVIGRVTTGSGGAFSGTYQPPRTWGLRLSYRH